jgi:hypothetical protein
MIVCGRPGCCRGIRELRVAARVRFRRGCGRLRWVVLVAGAGSALSRGHPRPARAERVPRSTDVARRRSGLGGVDVMPSRDCGVGRVILVLGPAPWRAGCVASHGPSPLRLRTPPTCTDWVSHVVWSAGSGPTLRRPAWPRHRRTPKRHNLGQRPKPLSLTARLGEGSRRWPRPAWRRCGGVSPQLVRRKSAGQSYPPSTGQRVPTA